MRWLLAFMLAFSLHGCIEVAAAGPLPDSRIAPGITNPDVTQATIGKTICVPGWTATIRPPASVTDKIKHRMLASLPDKNPTHYELDHLISLQLGGHPSDERNLWPEPYAGQCGARTKDRLETYLKRQVCAKRMTLASAQREIRTDWLESYRKRIGPLSCKGATP